MRIASSFEVARPLDDVWAFFDDIPQVAACLPGAELSERLDEDHYGGNVAIGLGPVRLHFDGEARITARDHDARRISVEASGADRKGRGQATMLLDAALADAPAGTLVDVSMDLQLSGPAAQYGRGLISDVTAVLLDDFAGNVAARLAAIAEGRDPAQVAASGGSAGGLAIGLRALRLALSRMCRRFLMPYRPEAV